MNYISFVNQSYLHHGVTAAKLATFGPERFYSSMVKQMVGYRDLGCPFGARPFGFLLWLADRPMPRILS